MKCDISICIIAGSDSFQKACITKAVGSRKSMMSPAPMKRCQPSSTNTPPTTIINPETTVTTFAAGRPLLCA